MHTRRRIAILAAAVPVLAGAAPPAGASIFFDEATSALAFAL